MAELADFIKHFGEIKMIAQIKSISGDLPSKATGNLFRVVELVNGVKLYAWKDTVKQALMNLQPGMQADFRLKGEGGQYPAIEDVVPVYQTQIPQTTQPQADIPATGNPPPNNWQPDPGTAVTAPINNPPAPVVEVSTQESIERQCALKAAVEAVGAFQSTLWNEPPTQATIQETILHFQQVFLQIIKGKIGGVK